MTRQQIRTMFENAFDPNHGFGLEWVCHEWLGDELTVLADAAAEVGLAEIAAALREATGLQKKIDDLPGDTATPEYEAWLADVEAVEARLHAGGGTADFLDAYRADQG